MLKPSGGIRSFLAVRLWLANADCCPCLYWRRCYSNLASPERGGGPAKLVEGFFREVQLLEQSCQNRPAEFARSSLSACGLPTPVVALACIGNVGIQVFSCAGGQLYFIRRLQVYLFIVFHVQPISQRVTLLFFFTEKKKRSKKRKEFAFYLYCKIPISPEDHTRDSHQQKSPGGANRRRLPP